MGVDKQGLEIPLISPGEEGELEIGDVDYETSDSDFTEGHDIDDILEVAGSGPFQFNLSLCICLVWAFNAALTMVTPFFVAGMRKEMKLSAFEEGITSASILFGFIVGNVVWGYLSDKWGRRICIYYSVLGSGLSNCVGATAPTWQLVALMRVATGIFIPGSMIASNSLISESVPRGSRGSWLAFLHNFWQLGTFAMVSVTYELDDPEEWRNLMLATGMPAVLILAVLYACNIPESARWLLLQKRRAEAIAILERVATMNGTTAQLEELQKESSLMDTPPHPTVSPLKEIFSVSNMARVTLPLWAMFFWLNYASYGLTMWLKAYFSKMGMNSVSRDLYLWMAGGKMLGCMCCTAFIDYFPRRWLLGVLFFCASTATFVAVQTHGGEDVVEGYYIDVTGDTVVLLLFTLEGFFEEAAWGTMYAYSVEVYPSSIRSTGSGVAMGFGRVGGIIATVIGRKIMQEDPRLPFYFVSFAFIMATVSAAFTRMETRGVKLSEL